MSRTVSAGLLAAIGAPTSYDIKAKVSIYNSLMAFGSYDRDYQPSDFPDDLPTYEARWEGSAAYFTSISKAVNAFIGQSGSWAVRFYCNPNAGVITPTYSGGIVVSPSPSLVDGYLYTVEGNGVYRYTINTSALSANNPACLSSKDTVSTALNFSTIGFAGVAGVSSTECVSFKQDTHGLKVRYHYLSGSWQTATSEDYIAFPLKPSTIGQYMYTRVTAAKLGDKIFAYALDPYSGKVLAKVLDTGTDGGGRNWSSTFTAVDADMSEFWPSSCFVANSKVHMSGAFRRTEDYVKGQHYNLILSSNDGYSFSMDRFTMVTTKPGLHACCTSGTTFYGMCCGAVGETSANYVVGSPTADLVVPDDDIINVSYNMSSPGGSGSIKIANGDHTYDNNAYLEEGNMLQLELGYNTSSGEDLVLMDTFIIAGVQEGIGDAENSLTLQIMSEAAWRLQSQTAPFYTEIDSNSALVDDITDEADKLYTAAMSGKTIHDFYVDFWHSTGWDMDSGTDALDIMDDGGVSAQVFDVSGKYAILTASVAGKMNLMDNPVVVEAPVDVQVYGWARTASTGITSPTIRCFLVIDDGAAPGSNDFGEIPLEYWTREREENAIGLGPIEILPGETSKYGGTSPGTTSSSGGDRNISKRESLGIRERIDGYKVVEGVLISTYDKFPLTYYDTVAGSNPIEFRWNSSKINVGDKIVRIGIMVTTAGATAFNFAGCRIKTGHAGTALSGVVRFDDTNSPWAKGEDMLTVPGIGRPFVMFATKPYFAYNFDVEAKFGYAGGTSKSTTGTVAFGLLGHAKDAQNFVLGRVNVVDNKLEIISMKSGKEKVLTSTAFTLSSTHVFMRFTHRDGIYSLYVKESADAKNWGASKLSYTWSDADGAQIPQDTIDIESGTKIIPHGHVGIYGTKEPLSWRCTGFMRGSAEAFALMPGANSEEALAFTNFPSSGEVIVNGSRYAFTGKTADGASNWTHGPWRGEATREVSYGTIQGVGLEIPYFDWNKSSTFWENYVVSADNGHVYMTQKTDWQPATMVDGALDYGDRIMSRHICAKLTGNYIGHSNRVCVGNGIAGIRARDELATSHPYGAYVNLYISDRIDLYSFNASGGDGDMTVKDMVAKIANAAGVKAEFPGDITHASQGLTGTPWTLR